MYKNVDILKMCLNVKNIYLTIYFIYIHTHIHIRIWTFNLDIYVKTTIYTYIYIYIYIYGCGKHLICISIQLQRHKKHWQLSIARRISAKYISCWCCSRILGNWLFGTQKVNCFREFVVQLRLTNMWGGVNSYFNCWPCIC